MLDNYDSFTFNLVQYLGELGAVVDVARNDHVTVDEMGARSPEAVVISPGPGGPREAGCSVDLVEWCLRTSTPLLGVCLGHQAIAVALGGEVVQAPLVMHGKTSEIHHDGRGVLRGLPDPFEAMRYHSLVVDRSSLPRELEVTAWTSDGVVMAIRHAGRRAEGVQFHPESILTGAGMDLLRNFLELARYESPTRISTV
ncbi:MAG: anthranilate synthase component II [Actinomycetota bacterium]